PGRRGERVPDGPPGSRRAEDSRTSGPVRQPAGRPSPPRPEDRRALGRDSRRGRLLSRRNLRAPRYPGRQLRVALSGPVARSAAPTSGEARDMDLGIAGKVVFFTGGSKGMGRIAARMLADEGCKVAVVARTKGPVDEAVGEITASGGTAIGVTADICQQDQVTAAVEQVARELGAPQIVVGQTMFTRPGDFEDI